MPLVDVDAFADGTIGDFPAGIEKYPAPANALERAQIMADEQDRAAVAGHVLHLAETPLLEFHVADGEHLVDDEDLRLEMGSDRKSQAHIHTGRVALHGRVQESLDLREGDDLVELAPDLRPRHAEDRPVQEDVLPPG